MPTQTDLKERIQEIIKEENRLRDERKASLSELEQQPLLSMLKEFKETRDGMIAQLRSKFPSFILPLMLKSESIQSIGFTAYAPYFNDGDECVYSVNTDYLYVNGDYDGDYNCSESDKALVKEMSKILGMISDDLYKDIFGNHVMVTVRRDGTLDVSDHEHD